ncbi:alpha/beta hydrolase [Iamia majanohamensis]|uniref:Alpha/beta hydrolase n=1 Tax=Iamia majanohamensis TaxID=467976 RepID=A0AAE9Y4J1_9ACTN|nr:alpha/beta hydrolase [Iamia majanohamensis]WCO66229.1 alpha/beta hydrolase [Iamia majanohamensis]
MTASVARANGIDIAYETFGSADDPPIVLVMGLGTQRIGWPDELCAQVADAGRFVVRFDNRDVGESTHLSELGTPSVLDLLPGRRPPYGLSDMAGDVVGLLDALGLDAVHLVGASLGGFIAQTVTIDHPDRVRTLTLIMTSTGRRRVGRPHPRVLGRLARIRRDPAATRDEAVEQTVEIFRLIGSPGHPFDEGRVRELAGHSYDRGYDPDGYRRQLAAILAQPDRTADLRAVTAPTLVVHGLADPLVGTSGGVALARTIPGARLMGFSGMGHDLPRSLWPTFAAEIVDHTAGATEPSQVRT